MGAVQDEISSSSSRAKRSDLLVTELSVMASVGAETS
jgi:hypothetical protein